MYIYFLKKTRLPDAYIYWFENIKFHDIIVAEFNQ